MKTNPQKIHLIPIPHVILIHYLCYRTCSFYTHVYPRIAVHIYLSLFNDLFFGRVVTQNQSMFTKLQMK